MPISQDTRDRLLAKIDDLRAYVLAIPVETVEPDPDPDPPPDEPDEPEPPPEPPPDPDMNPMDHHGVPWQAMLDAADLVVEGEESLVGEHGIVYVRSGGTLTIEDGASAITVFGEPGSTINLNGWLTILDRPFEDWDTTEWGHGLISFGRCHWNGEFVTPFVRSAGALLDGQKEITLESAPTNWQPGDVLAFHDSRRVTSDIIRGRVPRWDETAEIESVNGNVVTLRTSLQFIHPDCWHDGEMVGAPYVANLTRRIGIKSENPDGVRGHVAMSFRADPRIHNVEFRDLGRTRALDPIPKFPKQADHQGQIARYAFHRHHHIGPENPDNTGWQSEFTGCSINGFTRWGYVDHLSHYGLCENNVVWDGEETCIQCEEGFEFHNRYVNNFVARCHFGYWIAPHNEFEDCIAASTHHWPWSLGGTDKGFGKGPTRRGQHPDQYENVLLDKFTMTSWKRVEAISCAQNSHIGAIGSNVDYEDGEQNYFEGLLFWHCNQALPVYGPDSIKGSGLRVYSCNEALNLNGGGTHWAEIEDCVFKDCTQPIHIRPRDVLTRVVIDGIVCDGHIRYSYFANGPASTTTIKNAQFTGELVVLADTEVARNTDPPRRPYQLFINDEQVFFEKQAAGYVHQETDVNVPPEWIGKTNQQILDELGECYAGEIAKCETTRDGWVNVFVCPKG